MSTQTLIVNYLHHSSLSNIHEPILSTSYDLATDMRHSHMSNTHSHTFTITTHITHVLIHRHGTLRYFVSISILPRVVQNTSQSSKQQTMHTSFPTCPSRTIFTSRHMWIAINALESPNGVKFDWINMRILILCIKIINFCIENQNPEDFRLVAGPLSP